MPASIQNDQGHERAQARQRFEAKFMPVTECGCWIWLGATQSYGYGSFHLGTVGGAHRASWKLYRGLIPTGAHVLHTCDIPACVNPDHLYLGSHADNVADRVRRDRTHRWNGRRRGENSTSARLTPQQVSDIRQSTDTQRAIGARYGVHPTTIHQIRAGKSW